ncbi:MAG TPA: helix-hairpin-helix domain-containing protein, partial [Baekduia sp.]|nr:helix-hairpin-helix domain-containing protein [Baekduia sp.]
LAAAIAAGDTARLVAVPGIGKRTAERIVVELKEKIIEGALSGDGLPDGGGEIRISRSDEPLAIAREGLVGLGFSIEEADRMLADAEGDEPGELIRQALKAARA